jgi:NADH-quinone oxidoreductase subunit L
MFIFWELVGVSSFLLIGHWFEQDAPPRAANKAFLANRIGDFGFMLGILLLFGLTGTLSFADMAKSPGLASASPMLLSAAVLLIFCGTVGKSAQMPLHVWLPDAMEGPTPVSALIHAATMVAAGVYLLARVAFIMTAEAAFAMDVITAVGGITSLVAALIATQQNDIKKILAYSTLSQLGYMVMAVGLGNHGAAMYHLFTHAWFKALLFLGAGSVIHALHHEQDIWKMGGLSSKMRVTFITFGIGLLALTGCPLLAGFFSKEAILMTAAAKNPVWFVVGLVTAFLTAFYMTRLAAVVFFGKARSEEATHAHEGPSAMTLPLWILAIMSIFAGYVDHHGLVHWFGMTEAQAHGHGFTVEMALAIGVFVAGTAGAWVFYRGAETERLNLPLITPLLRNKFYIDEIYAALIAGIQDLVAYLCSVADKWIIDGLIVRGAGMLAWGTGFLLRVLQFGNLQGYALLFGAGAVALLYFVLFR